LTAAGSEGIDRNFVQIKLNDLRGRSAAGQLEDDA
jgi:hypothetical protein